MALSVFSLMLTGFDRIPNLSTTDVFANKTSIFNSIVGILFTIYRGFIKRNRDQ